MTTPSVPSISRGFPASTSWSIEVLCLPTFSAPSMRRSNVTLKWAPSFSATSFASVIMVAASSRDSGNWQIASRVEWVSALIGLKHRFPQSLSQISDRMSSTTGDLNPAPINASETRVTRSDVLPSSSPRGNRIPSTWRITPGSAMTAAGYAIQPSRQDGSMACARTPPGSTVSTKLPSYSPGRF